MFQKCFVLFLLSFALNVSFATDVLEFQSWVHGKKMMNIVVDDTGKIEGLLYKEVAKPLSHNAEPHSVEFQTVELHSKYYFIDRDYTCAKSLEPDFGAKCKNTCFPSYKQKGIDFHFNVQGDIFEIGVHHGKSAILLSYFIKLLIVHLSRLPSSYLVRFYNFFFNPLQLTM